MAFSHGRSSIFLLVETRGFEPLLREPKSLVLPLHHASIIKGRYLYERRKRVYTINMTKIMYTNISLIYLFNDMYNTNNKLTQSSGIISIISSLRILCITIHPPLWEPVYLLCVVAHSLIYQVLLILFLII